jgi:hypothetical protein
MRTITLSLFLLCVGLGCIAQCGMTTQLFVDPTCLQGSISVNTTGGTAPYTVVVEVRNYGTNGWQVGLTSTNVPQGDLTNYSFGSQLNGKDQARVTVTDGTNCVATHTSPTWQPTYQQMAFLFPYVDCVAGISTLVFQPSDMGNPAPAVSTWTYSLDGGALTPFLQNWTLIPGSSPVRYKYNFNVSAGSHLMQMPNVSTPTYYICGVYAGSPTTGPPIAPGDCGVNVAVRAALQGALSSGTVMGDSLRVHGLVPTIEPYSSLGYTYTGTLPGASITPSLLGTTGNNAVVDWVVVELRNSANSSQVMFSRPALLQRDGDVMDLDGDGYVNFPSASGNYYVALRHRNHLGVMASSIPSLGVSPATVDFRSSGTPCYGTTPRAQVGTVYCLWSGDGNGNGTLQYVGIGNDRDPILTAVGGTTPNNTLINVYDRRDVNMDGVVKYVGANNDRDPILTNVGSTNPNNTRTQQLP